MRDFYAFAPDAQRARRLNRRMRSDLARSLRYIARQVHGVVDFSPTRLNQFLANTRHQPASPHAFCLYHDLVLALDAENYPAAAKLFRELTALRPPAGGPRLIALPNPKKFSTGDRYARFITSDSTADFQIHPPSRDIAAGCRKQIKDAFALLDAADPELAAEIRALLVEIVLAVGTEDPKKMTFDGASAFMLWGAILINARRRDGAVGMVQMLAHESAHNLLYGFCADGPLVMNDPAERFPSPLRVDLRPMEGIYHATFVLARMHRAVKQLITSGILAGGELDKARKDLAENARLFFAGEQVVLRHGKLSPMGRSLMRGASRYMKSAA
jgi:hypothetical protein